MSRIMIIVGGGGYCVGSSGGGDPPPSPPPCRSMDVPYTYVLYILKLTAVCSAIFTELHCTTRVLHYTYSICAKIDFKKTSNNIVSFALM